VKKDNGKQEDQAQAQVKAQMQAHMQKQQQEQEKQQQYIQALMDGKQPTKNELVRYLVKELRDNNTELKAVSKTLQQAQQVVEQSQQRMIELRGIGRKYIQDIMANKDKDDSKDRKSVTPAAIPQPVV
jgi:3-oxoacyl-ACP reductase-like protein